MLACSVSQIGSLDSASQIFQASLSASLRSAPGMITANSSPPMRAVMSFSPTCWFITRPKARRHDVADLVTELVVDQLQVVDVHHQDAKAAA